MDIDPSILGPYAHVYLKEKQKLEVKVFSSKPPLKPQSGPSRPPTSTRANFGALHKKQNIKFLQDDSAKRQERQLALQQNRKSRRSQRFMESRKTNMTDIANEMNLLLHEENSNEMSSIESDIEPMTPIITENAKPKNGNLSKQTPSNNTGNKSNILNKNNNRLAPKPSTSTFKPAPVNSSVSLKESRREQLLKWKKEKEAADNLSKKAQKQPFKGGGAVKPANGGVPMTTTFINASANVSRFGGTRPVVPVAPKVAPSASKAESGVDGNGRRVTRAMTKAQTGTGNNSATTLKPVIQKMKTLNVSEKSKPGLTSKTGTGAVRAPPGAIKPPTVTSKTTNVSAKKPGPSTLSGKKDTEAATSSNNSQSNEYTKENNDTLKVETTNNTATTEVKPKKPLKAKKIDDIYSIHNAEFANACTKLNGYRSEWSKIIEDENINSEIKDDIFSVLGNVKLLLESKLPQFCDLLHSYVCQQTEPRSILPCDLQGWWDVASIQLDLVSTKFDKLKKLQQNNWVEEFPVITKPQQPEGPVKVFARPPKPKTASVPNVKASGSLKAFLANKRKMMGRGGNDGDGEIESNHERMDTFPCQEITTTPSDEMSEDGKADKTFEGGFFTVSSPLVTPSRRRVVDMNGSSSHINSIPSMTAAPAFARTPTRRISSTSLFSLPRTPNRRASETKRMSMTSLCMLSVRSSMGSLSKIGAVAISADDNNANCENHASTEF